MACSHTTPFGTPFASIRTFAIAASEYASFVIMPALARELFIRHALVYGEWHSRHRFLEENRRMLEEAAELEHRARRRDLVVDEHTLFDFYDARVGADVVSGAHFDWSAVQAAAGSLSLFASRQITIASTTQLQ